MIQVPPDKTRFVDCVMTWIRSGTFDSARSYHWFMGDGEIVGACFTVRFYKKRFKQKVKLARWVEEGKMANGSPRRVGYYIPLTEEESQKLWDLQSLADIHQEAKNDKGNAEWKAKMERLQWYP